MSDRGLLDVRRPTQRGVNRRERATISLLRYDEHPAGNSGNNVNERAGLTGRNVNDNAHINSN